MKLFCVRLGKRAKDIEVIPAHQKSFFLIVGLEINFGPNIVYVDKPLGEAKIINNIIVVLSRYEPLKALVGRIVTE